MSEARSALTPDALTMVDAIARSGSFAAAARELGKVPSALTYSVRQLEDALDVLLFDRRSRQATLTAAGQELLDEGRRLLEQIDAVANRVKRVATGWETQLSIAVDGVISEIILLELCEAFYAGTSPSARSRPGARDAPAGASPPATRLRLRTEVLAGTWEALVTGQADLAIGVGTGREPPSGVTMKDLGPCSFVFAVAPHHPLAAAERADRRRRADPASRRRRRRFRAAPGADDGEPAARPGRAHGQQHAGRRSTRCCARSAAASCPSRWRASTSRPAGWWSRRCSGRGSRRASAMPGARRAPAAQRRAQGRSRGSPCAGGSSSSRAPTTRQALLERHGSGQPYTRP